MTQRVLLIVSGGIAAYKSLELVRQLRGGLGARQVEGAQIGQYVHDVAGKCKSIIYTKGA